MKLISYSPSVLEEDCSRRVKILRVREAVAAEAVADEEVVEKGVVEVMGEVGQERGGYGAAPRGGSGRKSQDRGRGVA